MKKVYIVAAKRTPIGSFMGSLKTVSAVEMGSCVVKQLLCDTGVDPAKIDEVIVGNILSAGLCQGIARQISIKSGVDEKVPAYGVNMICGSGMKSVMNGYMSIAGGFSELIIAGGVESMSRAAYTVDGAQIRNGNKMGNINFVDSMVNDALTDAFDNVHMGVTAENIAAKFNISREKMDEYAFNSQQKAISAVDNGRFDDEIVKMSITAGKETFEFNRDEYPNRKSTLEKLATLKPAFIPNGKVTAGNSSGINDGASFMMLASEDAVKLHKLTPIAEIISIGQAGVSPKIMGMGPVPAIKNALNNANLKLSDIELMELNEAFAAQSLAVIESLSAEHKHTTDEIISKTNVNGGAIALGHPVGASGNRIIVSLLYEMIKRKNNYGLASLCIGGGMGTAIIIKRS